MSRPLEHSSAGWSNCLLSSRSWVRAPLFQFSSLLYKWLEIINLMKHKHHNPPRHRVGDHDVTIELSITQHAMFHFCEWQLHGLREDRLAWMSLTRQISQEEIQHERSSIGGRNNAGKQKSTEHRAKISASNIGGGGFNHTPESKEKHRQSMMGNTNSHSQKSPESKARHSEIMKAAWARRKNTPS